MSPNHPSDPAPPPLLHWGGLPPGTVLECGTLTVDREEVLDFARRFDPQPFHLDEAAAQPGPTSVASSPAAGTPPRWRCAPMCDGYLHRAASLGSPGIDKLSWPAPVRPGDTLHLRMTVLSARPMRNKPQAGLIESRWEMFNQRGELRPRHARLGHVRPARRRRDAGLTTLNARARRRGEERQAHLARPAVAAQHRLGARGGGRTCAASAGRLAAARIRRSRTAQAARAVWVRSMTCLRQAGRCMGKNPDAAAPASQAAAAPA